MLIEFIYWIMKLPFSVIAPQAGKAATAASVPAAVDDWLGEVVEVADEQAITAQQQQLQPGQSEQPLPPPEPKPEDAQPDQQDGQPAGLTVDEF